MPRTAPPGLNRRQKTDLKKEPDPGVIRTREEGGQSLAYLEGWYVIAEANRIFGTENWDRVTLTTQSVWQGRIDGRPACAVTARVRICLRAGSSGFVREGSGYGLATGPNPGDAHGQALKTAETDATKRALATLGAPFGLTLYDHQAKPDPTDTPAGRPFNDPASVPTGDPANDDEAPACWMIYSETGEVRAAYREPVTGCSALRRALDAADTPAALQRLFEANRRFIARLAHERPDLRDATDRHYSEILSALYQRRLKRLSPPPGATGLTPERDDLTPPAGQDTGPVDGHRRPGHAQAAKENGHAQDQ